MSFLQQKCVCEGANERERGCADGLEGVYGNRDKKTEHSGVSCSARGSFPSACTHGHGGRWDGMGDRGMVPYGAEGNSSCIPTQDGTSIAAGDLQLLQKATRPKPLPGRSHTAHLPSGAHPALSKAKQKKNG